MAKLTGAVMATPATDSTTRSTTAKANVGSRAFSEKGEFVYVCAGAAFPASGSVGPVSVPSGGSLSAVVTGDLDTGGFIGVADAAFASGEYGYVQTKGFCTAVVESGAVAGDELQLTATAGKLKKITTSGSAVAVALEASDNNSLEPIDIFIR